MASAKDRTKIAKTAKEERERETLSREVFRADAIRELESHIKASREADDALKTLEQAGCNRETILWSLYKFCGGTRAEADAVKRAFRSRREFLLKLSERLKRLPEELQKAKSYLSDMGLDIAYPQDLIEQISSLADFLKDLANGVVRRYAWQRTSGRNHHLVHLAALIKKVTGREHYPELADLVNAIRWGYDSDCKKTETAETLRNLVDRNRPLDLVFSPKNPAKKRRRKPKRRKQRTPRRNN